MKMRKFLNQQRKPWWMVLFFSATMLFMWSVACTERHRTNPFDPKGESPPIIDLQLSPSPDHILLEWNLTRTVEGITGYRIFRGEGSRDNIRFYKEVPASQMSFVDTLVQQGVWYFYNVTAMGKSTESPPSRIRKALLGNGTCWVLSRFGERVVQLSYDLQHKLADFQIFTRPDSWVVQPGDSIIWINFTLFDRGLVKLNRQNGNLNFFYLDNLKKPVDIAFDNESREVYILDNELHKVFIFNGLNLSDSINIDSGVDFSEIEFNSFNHQLYLLGDTQVLGIRVNQTQPLITRFVFPSQFSGVDLNVIGNTEYLLVNSAGLGESIIYTLTNDLAVTDSLVYPAVLHRLGVDWVNELFYAAEPNGNNGDFLVQLSAAGQRQFRLSGFRRISFIAINPFDRTVVITDDFADNLVLIDPDGNIISQLNEADEAISIEGPIRIFVE